MKKLSLILLLASELTWAFQAQHVSARGRRAGAQGRDPAMASDTVEPTTSSSGDITVCGSDAEESAAAKTGTVSNHLDKLLAVEKYSESNQGGAGERPAASGDGATLE